MELKEYAQLIQEYLSNAPLIVLGSGASAAFGLPTMVSLANEIESHASDFSDPAFFDFCSKIKSDGFESAMDKSALNDESKARIRALIWSSVNEKDFMFFEKLRGMGTFSIAELFKKLIAATPLRVNVVTTNYDRLAEYAADLIGASVVTGFEGSLIRSFEDENQALINRRVAARERTIKIIKVHGSLDWFSDGSNLISYPLSRIIPDALKPVIIPPGKEKYYETHEDPYRTLITQADKAFKDANSYLCLGYGFNDEHIQPILLREIRHDKPIVVLTKNMTSACESHLSDNHIKKKIIIEESGDNSMITGVDGKNEIFKGAFWTLEGFLDALY